MSDLFIVSAFIYIIIYVVFFFISVFLFLEEVWDLDPLALVCRVGERGGRRETKKEG